MKCVVFAYHNIGCAGVEALLKNGYEIAAIFTHKDNPQENIWFDSVAELGCRYGIPVYAPESVNHPIWVGRIKSMAPDILFSFYFREMLSEEILSLAKHGAVNLHGSLLPKYRGRVPLNWALINGEKEAGVTLHYMTAKADAGDIIDQEAFAIADSDDIKSVFCKAVRAAETVLARSLPRLADGTADRRPQNDAEATKFPGRKPADGEICWNNSAESIRNLVRAVTRPYPGAFTTLIRDGKEIQMKIFGSRIADPETLSALKSKATDRFPDGRIPAGTVISDDRTYLAFTTSDGAVLIEDLQLAGKKRMAVNEFLLGFRDAGEYAAGKGTSAEVKKRLQA